MWWLLLLLRNDAVEQQSRRSSLATILFYATWVGTWVGSLLFPILKYIYEEPSRGLRSKVSEFRVIL